MPIIFSKDRVLCKPILPGLHFVCNLTIVLVGSLKYISLILLVVSLDSISIFAYEILGKTVLP